MSVEKYVQSRLTVAKEAVESGIYVQNGKDILLGIQILQSIDKIVDRSSKDVDDDGKVSFWKQLRSSMVRACSAMSILDRAQGPSYLDLGIKYEPDSAVLWNNYGFFHSLSGKWDQSKKAY